MNRASLIKRIIIGSANFTQEYGIIKKKINLNEIKKILNLAKKNKINLIDTAESYLNKNDVYKKINNKFKFSSKILPDKKWISLDFCQKKLKDHFKNLKSEKIEIIHFHDTKILFTEHGPKIFNNLEKLKKKNYFNKIGLSIYDTDVLNYITNHYNFDIVQCPYNVLDQRILTTGWFNKLKKLGIEVHVRSIFLQGLLVKKEFHEMKHFKKWKKKISSWFNWLENNNISPVDFCFSDLLKYDFDRVLIGVNNIDNLKEIINFKKVNANKTFNFNTDDNNLIDPRKWKLNEI